MEGYARNNYSVIHYSQLNGYPGSYAYSLHIDRNGYLWVGSENGLTRFNGYEFKLFTTRDGLPDNEVLNMAEDQQGRFWLAPFANQVAYMKNGQLYHTGNTPWLKLLVFKAWCEGMFPDRFGNVIFTEHDVATVLTPGDKILRYKLGNEHITSDSIKWSLSDKGWFYIWRGHEVLRYNHDHFEKVYDTGQGMGEEAENWLTGKLIDQMGFEKITQLLKQMAQPGLRHLTNLQALAWMHSIFRISDDVVGFNRKDGCFILDLKKGAVIDTLLYGYNVSIGRVTGDGSIWLGTLGGGFFRFVKSPVRALPLTDEKQEVLTIRAFGQELYIMLEGGRAVRAQMEENGEMKLQPSFFFYGRPDFGTMAYIGKTPDGQWVSCAGKVFLHEKPGSPPVQSLITGYCKDVVEEDDQHLLVATGIGLTRVSKQPLRAVDTLCRNRTTSVAMLGNKVYVGTLNGLVAGDVHGPLQKVFDTVPELNIHILKLCKVQEGVLCVANNRAELVMIVDGRVAKIIDGNDGLQCNRISAMKTSTQWVWIGTDNGVYAIEKKPPYAIVRHVTYNSGLNSNQVRCLEVSGRRIFAGTSKGVNYFDEQEVFEVRPKMKIVVNSITNGDSAIIPSDETMRLTGKVLSIDFDIVDLEGGQQPMYQYCINDDNNWIKLDNSSLYFAAAPLGRFTITIRALSPNLNQDTLRQFRFYRAYPFYLRWWFIGLAVILLAALVLLIVRMYLRYIRRKDQEKLQVQRNLLQLEQMALQAQLNPHFIFNCLAAIKQHYNSGNTNQANGFVDAFAALIRQTFEMGTETFVSLDKELKYLDRYLSVERERFNHSFSFVIEKKLKMPDMDIPVPAMLLQPMVENAVRHGVRHLPDGEGHIRVLVEQEGDRVSISISDNGPGMKRVSEGMGVRLGLTSTTVNRKRVDILNRIYDDQIILRADDILNDKEEVAGTRIFISYPLSVKDYLNQ
jgi:signal transduction histidine kinase